MKMVTENAVRLRVDRLLRRTGDRLCICRRGSRSFYELGRYYVVNERNVVDMKHFDIEDFAREVGLLKPDEAIQPYYTPRRDPAGMLYLFP